jgi:Diphosphoinositol pentakisphosphate kinase 2 N-terminal domain
MPEDTVAGDRIMLEKAAAGNASALSSTMTPPTPNNKTDDHKNDQHHHTAKVDDTGRIRLGICAMDKKARSKPMAEILSRLDESNFKVVFFGDNCILNSPIEEWPICDALIAFFSKCYPLQKVKDYAALRKPFILNDLSMQDIMKDRRRIYDLLADMGIDVPRHVFVNRDGYKSTRRGEQNDNEMSGESPKFVECDDHIEVDKVSIHKPFVEKPVNAEGRFLQQQCFVVVFATYIV